MIRVIQRNRTSGRRRAIMVAGVLAIAAVVGPPATASHLSPTAHVEDGGDGFINASEAGAVTVTGTYPTGAGITTISVRVVNTIADVSLCEGVETTPVVNVTVDGTTGTYSAGPFNLTGFSEGAVVCARARASHSGPFSAPAFSDNLPVKDTVVAPPSLSAITNPITSANQTAVEVSVTAEADGTAKLFINDSDPSTPGLFQQFTSNGSAQTRTYNASSLTDGNITTRLVFRDRANNATPDISIVVPKDATGPAVGTVEMPDADGYLNAAEATTSCCIPANWAAAAGSDAVSAKVWFEDADGATPPGCGPWDPAGNNGFGNVNATCAANLPQGTFSFLGQWRDSLGNLSEEASASLVKDTLIGLTVTQPTSGQTVASLVEFKGTTDPGADVEIFEGLTSLGTITAGASGAWSLNVVMPAGFHSLDVFAMDPAGNSTSVPLPITVDPSIPIITAPTDSSFHPSTVLVRGTAPAGEDVEIFEGSDLLMTTTTDSTGNFQVHVAFDAGPHTIKARLASPTSPFSFPRTFTVDGNRPTVGIDNADGAVFLPLIEPQMSGTAGDNLGVVRVELRYYNQVTGQLIAVRNATCPSCGVSAPAVTWTDNAPTTLPGAYRLEAVSEDAGGNRSRVASIRYLV